MTTIQKLDAVIAAIAAADAIDPEEHSFFMVPVLRGLRGAIRILETSKGTPSVAKVLEEIEQSLACITDEPSTPEPPKGYEGDIPPQPLVEQFAALAVRKNQDLITALGLLARTVKLQHGEACPKRLGEQFSCSCGLSDLREDIRKFQGVQLCNIKQRPESASR